MVFTLRCHFLWLFNDIKRLFVVFEKKIVITFRREYRETALHHSCLSLTWFVDGIGGYLVDQLADKYFKFYEEYVYVHSAIGRQNEINERHNFLLTTIYFFCLHPNFGGNFPS